MLIVTSTGLRSGTSALMNVFVNDLGFDLVGEQFPEEAPPSGNPEGYFECTDKEELIEALTAEDNSRKVAKLWPPMLDQLVNEGYSDGITAIITLDRQDKEAMKDSQLIQFGREEAWREAKGYKPLDALEMPSAKEQEYSWPRLISRAYKAFGFEYPIVLSAESLRYEPVDTLFQLKMRLQDKYEDLDPYAEVEDDFLSAEAQTIAEGLMQGDNE